MSEFTPVQAILGGLILGSASAAFLLAHGRILGVSGLCTMFLSGEDKPKAFDAGSVLLGLVLGSSVCYFFYSEFSFPGPLAFPAWRYSLGAFAVGLGANLGHGCTSGHGVAGLARLSKRSFYAVGTFMGTAMVTASISHIVETGKASIGFAPIPKMTMDTLMLPLIAVVLAPLILIVTERIGSKFLLRKYKTEQHIRSLNLDRPCHASKILVPEDRSSSGSTQLGDIEIDEVQDLQPTIVLPAKEFVRVHMFLIGFVFSVGLGVSGMTSQAKITGFLALTNGAWDPSLMLVMGAALVPSYIANYFTKKAISCEACPSMGLHYMVPNRTNIDARLIAGAAIFGFGWGFSGWCPGPAIANLFPVWFDNSQVAAFYVINLAAGLWCGRLMDYVREQWSQGGQGEYLPWSQRARLEHCEVCG